MDSLKKLLSDALASLALGTRAAMRLGMIAIPIASQALRAVVRTARSLIGIARETDYRAKAGDVRKTARKGQQALSKLAAEAEARRTGRSRKRREDRLRNFGVAGAAAAGIIAILLYIPRKLIGRSGSEHQAPVSVTPTTPARPEPKTASSETNSTQGAMEAEPAGERPSA